MKGLPKEIDAEYPTRVEMARRGISEDKEYAAEDRYEMDRTLRRLVFHYRCRNFFKHGCHNSGYVLEDSCSWSKH
jgi:exonuclease I